MRTPILVVGSLFVAVSAASIATAQEVERPYGRDVVVRIYFDLANHPESYQGVVVPFNFPLEFAPEIEDNAQLVLILPSDQDDSDILDYLGRKRIIVWNKAVRPHLHQVGLYPEGKKLRFVDALDEPIPGASVEMVLQFRIEDRTLRIPLETVKTDADGRAALAFVDRDLDGKQAVTHDEIIFRVSHPEYGECEFDMQLPNEKRLEAGAPYQVPLVRRDSPEAARALRGVVLDPQGEPLPGAVVELTGADGPSGQHLRISPAIVVAGVDGEFRVFSRVTEAEGGPIPLGSKIFAKLRRPDAPSGPSQDAWAVYDGFITFQPSGDFQFHRFAFEDVSGPIQDPKILNAVRASAYWDKGEPGAMPVQLDASTLHDGGIVPAGWCHASAEWTENGEERRLQFDPLLICSDSPETVVFKLRPRTMYSGRVLHGVTDAPLAGAFVFTGNILNREKLAQPSPEIWDALLRLPRYPDSADPTFQLLEGIIDVHEGILGRTDGGGQYSLAIPEGASNWGDALVFYPGFLDFLASRWTGTGDENGDWRMPDIRMFPSAEVEISLSEKAPQVVRGHFPVEYVHWMIEAENNPPWAAPLTGARFYPYGWVEEDTHRSMNIAQDRRSIRIHVPGGVQMGLSLQSNDESYQALRIPGPLTFAPSQTCVLGPYAFQPAAQVRVVCRDSAGAPVGGLSLNFVCPGRRGQWATTNDEGAVKFFADTGVASQFRICRLTSPPTATLKTLEWQANDTGEQEIVLTLEDEVIRAARDASLAAP